MDIFCLFLILLSSFGGGGAVDGDGFTFGGGGGGGGFTFGGGGGFTSVGGGGDGSVTFGGDDNGFEQQPAEATEASSTKPAPTTPFSLSTLASRAEATKASSTEPAPTTPFSLSTLASRAEATEASSTEPAPTTPFSLSTLASRAPKCNAQALGMQNGDIPDSRITASSFGQSLYRPEQGRLHYQGDGGFKLPAWEVSPGSNRIGEWIQIDLGSVTNVTGVATQGNGIIAKQEWVTSYSLQSSFDGSNFEDYQGCKSFDGNCDHNTVVKHDLEPPIRARYIRLLPKAWHYWIALRIELYGCSKESTFCTEALGMQSRAIPDSSITASSYYHVVFPPEDGRLHKESSINPGMWSPADARRHGEWLQVDLGKVTMVTAIATQGKPHGSDEWVKSYSLKYSNNGSFFHDYFGGKVLDGNRDRNTVVKHELVPPINARYVRVYPKTWYKEASLRMELYGCKSVCQGIVNMAFLMDSSGSITREDWSKMKSFVSATIADMLKMRSANRFAVVSYSTEAQVEFHFNDVQGTNATAAKYAKLVQSIPHHRGLSFIDKALIVANKSVFTEAAGMKLGASQVALIITDGKQTTDKGPYTPLDQASKYLKDKGVLVYALGIGSAVNQSLQLQTLASCTSAVFLTTTFNELPGTIPEIVNRICSHEAPAQPVLPTKAPPPTTQVIKKAAKRRCQFFPLCYWKRK